MTSSSPHPVYDPHHWVALRSPAPPFPIAPTLGCILTMTRSLLFFLTLTTKAPLETPVLGPTRRLRWIYYLMIHCETIPFSFCFFLLHSITEAIPPFLRDEIELVSLGFQCSLCGKNYRDLYLLKKHIKGVSNMFLRRRVSWTLHCNTVCARLDTFLIVGSREKLC